MLDDRRASLLQAGPSANVIAYLFAALLHPAGVGAGGPSACLPPLLPAAPPAWAAAPNFREEPLGDEEDARAVVRLFLNVAERGGSDVRLDAGVPYRPRAWPRSGVPARLWAWRIVHGYPWRKGSQDVHINALELLAYYNSLRWRVRAAERHGCRCLALLDSQVAAAVAARGRSSSRRLMPILKRINALCLACGLYPTVAYVDTDDNPADVPSRWASLATGARGA